MRFVAAAVTVMSLAIPMGSALAADLPVKARPIPVEVWNWTGFYLGGNVGYSWGRDPVDYTASSTTRTRVFRAFGLPAETLLSDVTAPGFAVFGTDTAKLNGWVGGGQIGYNWQINTWVWGLEADIQATGQRGDVRFCPTPGCPTGITFESAEYKLKWFGTLRARAGMLVDPRVLVYVTGGLAYGDVESSYTGAVLGVPVGTVSSSSTKAGWVIGAGIEGLLTRNWSVKAEYLYMDLGSVGGATLTGTGTTITPNAPTPGFTTVVDTTISQAIATRVRDNIFRIGINYRFDPGPVVARY